MRIHDRVVGSDAPAFLIVEVAQAHGGSIAVAHQYIDVVADAGFDAVKFQTHLAEHESTMDEPFRVRLRGGADETRYDYWKRMEFCESEWQELARHAAERGLVFLSSAFSVEAVKLLQRVGVPAWKVGSGEFASRDLVAAMAESRLPVIMSTGMMRYGEIDDAVRHLRDLGVPFALLQCTSAYPTRLEDVGLNVIGELRERYRCPVGLSDHSGNVQPGLAAIHKGADLLEVHVKLSADDEGPDASSSLLPNELKLLAGARDARAVMAANPVDKDEMAEALSSVRSIFTKSLALVRDFPAGTVLERWMLTMKKPGGGLQAADLGGLIGKKLVRDISAKRLLRREDVER